MRRSIVLAAIASLALCDTSVRRASPARVEPPHARSALGLRFEANVGQADPSVRFVARYGRATVLVAPDALVLVPPASRPRRSDRHVLPMPAPAARGAPRVLRLRGANRAAVTSGEAPLAASITSFRGPSAEPLSIPAFERVRARDVYPGIDLVLHHGPRGLEIDFEVAPFADPSVIAIGADRGEAPVVRGDGSLAFGDALVLSPPRTFDAGGALVASAWTASGDARFALGAYASGARLVIDPVLDMATYVGGGGDDVTAIGGVALDASGAVYVAGTTTSPDLPVTAGAPDATLAGTDDAFVAKVSGDGKTLVWCTYVGGSGVETYAYLERPVVVDAAGAAYVSGQTTSADFPTTPGAYDRTANGGYDAFVTKIAPDGRSLLYSTYLGSSGDDHGFGLGLDGTSAIVGGWTKGLDFPTTPGAIPTTSTGFVTKLAPDGGSLVYSTMIGGATSVVFGLTAKDGYAYAIGDVRPGPFPVTPGVVQPNYGGGSFDAFLVKLKKDGSGYEYATYIGGDGLDESWQIAVDAAGDALVVGNTQSTNFPITPNAYMSGAGGDADGWVAKIDAKGQKLLYGATFAGPSVDGMTGACFDPAGNAFVTGTTMGGIPGKASCVEGGPGFVQMIEPSGNVRFLTFLPEQVYGVACGPSRVVGFMSVFGESGLATSGAFDPTANGGIDELVFGLRPGPSGDGCKPCDGSFGAATPHACPDAARPLCNATGPLVGSCTKCTSGDLTRCAKGEVCSPVTGECGPPEPPDAGGDAGVVDGGALDAAAAADAGAPPSDAGAASPSGGDEGCSCRAVAARRARAVDLAFSAMGMAIAIGWWARRRRAASERERCRS
jgi:hypothetical protein